MLRVPQLLEIEPHFVRKGSPDPKSQFYFSFWRSNLISCERVALGQAQIKIAILRQFLAIEPSFRAKMFAGRFADRIFFAIEPHFVRKGCAIGRVKSQFYLSF